MTGDDVALMTSVGSCYTRSERFIAGSVAAMVAAAWPENCDVADTMLAVTRLEA